MKAYYNSEFKIITYSSDDDVVEIPEVVGNVEIDEDMWLNLSSKSDDVYLDEDTPDDFTKITTKTPVVDLPAEMIEAIEFGERQAKKNEALEYLARYQALQLAPTLGNNELLTLAPLYPDWEENMPYVAGDPINHNGILFKVKQAHTSQADWTPDVAVSLFAKVLTDPNGGILPWEQPDSTNPYMTGDRVIFNGKTYESVIDNNIWSPDGYPEGWKEV